MEPTEDASPAFASEPVGAFGLIVAAIASAAALVVSIVSSPIPVGQLVIAILIVLSVTVLPVIVKRVLDRREVLILSRGGLGVDRVPQICGIFQADGAVMIRRYLAKLDKYWTARDDSAPSFRVGCPIGRSQGT